VAFLYTGQGSQYVNMLADLRAREPIVAAGFERGRQGDDAAAGAPADVLHLHRRQDPAAVSQLEKQLADRDHPAGACWPPTRPDRLLAAYGMRPDMVMGHSLGEYGALVPPAR
jgi:acyl transferase domain-containing protein